MICLGLHHAEDIAHRHTLASHRAMADMAQAHAQSALLAPQRCANRSHSRGVAGAVASDTAFRIGLDIEFVDLNRPWMKILNYMHDGLGDVSAGDPAASCRVWTLYEAWYKAFGAFASRQTLADWLTMTPAPDMAYELGDGIFAWRTLWQGFEICIVWSGTDEQPDLRVLTGL